MNIKINSLACILFTLILISTNIAAQQFKKGEFEFLVENAPDWITVNQVSSQFFPDSKTETSYFLVDRQTNVAKETEFYSRTVLRLNTPTGVENNSQLTFDFDPSYESLIIHKIDVIREGKVLNKLNPETVVFVQQEKQLESLMYVGTVSALFVLNDIRPGDILDYSVSVKGRNPVFGDRFFSSVKLGWAVDVGKQFVKYRAPNNMKLNIKLLKSDTEIQQIIAEDYVDYIWQKDNIKATYYEDAFPYSYQPVPVMLVSEYKNWNEVSDWALPLYEKDKPLSKEIVSLMKEWKLKSATKSDYAKKALRYLQDEIRYFGVEFGRNSHMPSHPNEVIKRRYGDCKDKSLTLATMLRAANINASLALVSYRYREGIAELLPSPGVFDHVIVKADIDGKDLWLDPTRIMQRGPLNFSPITPFGKALVVEKNSQDLKEIQSNEQQFSETFIHETVVATSFWRPAVLTVTTKYSGKDAEYQRRRFSNKDLKQISRQYFEYYANIYSRLSQLKDLRFFDDEEKNMVTTIEAYEIPSFWQYDMQGAWFTAYGYGVKDFTALPKSLQRKMPLGLKPSVHLKHQFSVKYPKILNKFLPLKTIVVEDEAVSFRREARVVDNKYELEFEYHSKTHSVETKKVTSHISTLRKINKVLEVRPLNQFDTGELHKIMLDKLTADI